MSLWGKVKKLEDERNEWEGQTQDAQARAREALSAAGFVVTGRWVVLFASSKPTVSYDGFSYWGVFPTAEDAKHEAFEFFAHDLRHRVSSGGPRMIYPEWAHIVRVTPQGFVVLSEVYGETVDNETTWKWRDVG